MGEKQKGTLYVISLPIGNLKDITLRALEVLKNIEYIACEDTRSFKKLIHHYQLGQKKLISLYKNVEKKKEKKLIEFLERGINIALVSEAGTPGISDPGNELIAEVIEKFGDKVEIIPIPGPSALTTIASIAGIPMQKFLFLGFVPKRKQKKFFQEIVNSKYPVIFFESPYRIIKTLEKLQELEPDLKVVVARELTKKFETIYRGTLKEVINSIRQDKIKGEFVVVVHRV